MPGGSGRETPAGGRGPLRRGCAMVTRRQLLKAGAVGGAGLLVPWEAVGRAWAAIPGGSLDPTTIHKYAAPLVIPPVMPPLTGPRNQSIDRYAIAVRQFRQQVLPPGMPATTVWGYGSAPHRGTLNYPAFTIEARVDRPVRVKWINDLVDRNGRYLPHLLPVDPTLHWANPPGGPAGFYLLRGGPDDLPAGVLPGPAPRLGDPAGTRYYEIPIAVQDRSFNADGSLFYPAS